MTSDVLRADVLKVYFDGTSGYKRTSPIAVKSFITCSSRTYFLEKIGGSEKNFWHCGNNPFSSRLKEVDESGYSQE
jgi:hypothetical protein